MICIKKISQYWILLLGLFTTAAWSAPTENINRNSKKNLFDAVVVYDLVFQSVFNDDSYLGGPVFQDGYVKQMSSTLHSSVFPDIRSIEGTCKPKKSDAKDYRKCILAELETLRSKKIIWVKPEIVKVIFNNPMFTDTPDDEKRLVSTKEERFFHLAKDSNFPDSGIKSLASQCLEDSPRNLVRCFMERLDQMTKENLPVLPEKPQSTGH